MTSWTCNACTHLLLHLEPGTRTRTLDVAQRAANYVVCLACVSMLPHESESG